jgi:NAD(P)H-dependent FMN reductase
MSTLILALVGSLRASSYNRRLAQAAAKYAPEGIDVEIFEGLGEVPFYNEDLDRPGEVPDPAQALRDAVQRADALLLVTPEYNGSPPAVLKNAIDWTSRPDHAGAITGKPVAVAGTSNGRYGCGPMTTPAKLPASPGRTCSRTSSCQWRVQPSGSPPSISHHRHRPRRRWWTY